MTRIKAKEKVLDEYKRYMQEPLTNWRVNNVMEWWSDNQVKFPHVALMALKYLAIPASSAPSESILTAKTDRGTKKMAHGWRKGGKSHLSSM